MQNSHIIQLPPEVIGQIAAGEVVERPAAAIKELIENSMDAGATAITVEIRDGGITSFRVVDNGSGIQSSDIRLAFARHATSKIRRPEDLYGVRTLGFRGEALASIAAVSKVTCTTRIKEAECGISARCEGGEMQDIKEAACPEGTSFTVRDLFFNAPVRRKFLKKPSIETSYVSDLMMRMILSHPQISFRYIADGKTIYFSPGDGKLESAVLSIYGVSTLEKMHHISGNMNGIVLEGYIGTGELSRGNRSHQSFILNGRLIRSDLLSSALEEGCRQRVMIGRYPICVLHLTMPYESADVNVHPNKWEVRFQNESSVRQAIQVLISNALSQDTPLGSAPALFPSEAVQKAADIKRSEASTLGKENIKPFSDSKQPDLHYEMPDSVNSQREYTAKSPDAFAHKAVPAPTSSITDNNHYADSSTDTLPFSANLVHEKSTGFNPDYDPQALNQQVIPDLRDTFDDVPVRLIGAVFNTYIILEAGDRMLLCDQHAVHERLLYERFMRETDTAAMSQPFLVPEILQLTHREYQIFLESRQALKNAGFDVEDFGSMAVQVRAVPMVLGQARSTDCLRDALDELSESGRLTDQKRTNRIIQMACKHAVKGGERAPMEALMDLIRRMIRDNVTPTCPHGRPLVIEVTQKDLEKRFHRIQN